LALVAVLLVACGSTISNLVELWDSNPEYSHGYFVPLFTLWIFYTRREEIRQSLREKQSAAVVLTGTALILLGGGMRVAGVFARALSVEGASLPVMLAGVCFAALGRVTALRLLPAVMFLIFMIPVPGVLLNDIGLFLQGVATEVSTVCFQLVGIPAMHDGIVIALPNTELQIAEACSGIRMLITLAAMLSAYCIVSPRTLFEKALLLLSAVPIAVTVNVLRIVATGAAHEYLPKWADGIHDAAGWLMMIAGFLLLLFELWIFRHLFSPADGEMDG
jgi:exosortase